MKIHERGFWLEKDGHGEDPQLARAIADFLVKENCHSCIDLGAGRGYYVEVINNAGIPCVGVDGNPFSREFNPDLYIADLTEYHYFGNFDWCLSLEVGEHIPFEFEDAYLSNIEQSANKGVIISWAIPGQGGDGHINCHPNDYVIDRFNKLGFRFDDPSTTLLRRQAARRPECGWWFRNSLLVFFRKENNGC